MRLGRFRWRGLLAGALLLVSAPWASAQPAELDETALALAHDLYGPMDLKVQSVRIADYDIDSFGNGRLPLEWAAFMNQAAAEEADNRRPEIERIVARELSDGFTPAELKAGLALMQGPSAAALGQALADLFAGKPRAVPLARAARASQAPPR